jgi:hypothetical protein
MSNIRKNVVYNYNLLEELCKTHNLQLLKDYSNVKLNRDSCINCKCVNNECNNEFIKKFRDFIRVANFGCKICSKVIFKERVKNTCMLKYGAENPFSSSKIREKITKTFIEKYGYNTPSKSIDVIDKIIQTNIKKYGEVSPLKNQEIKYKLKQNYLLKYGVDNPRKLKQTLDKQKETNLIKYGCENQFQNEEIKTKIKNTNLEKYGVQFPSQSQHIKDKIKNTIIEKYGCENAMQNSDIMEKSLKMSYKVKEYIFHSGRKERIQGYEHFALDELTRNNISEDDIVLGPKNVPVIWYLDEFAKKHRHYVDIYVKTLNKCIEVKSVWTFNNNKSIVLKKQETAKTLGLNYEIWIYNSKGIKINVLL